jgi:hypothetical protein
MEFYIPARRKPALCDIQRLVRGIDAMEPANPGRDARSPAPRSATQVEAFGTCRKVRERENREIAVEQLLIFAADQTRLVECGPFLSESLDRFPINIRGTPLWFNQFALQTPRESDGRSGLAPM